MFYFNSNPHIYEDIEKPFNICKNIEELTQICLRRKRKHSKTKKNRISELTPKQLNRVSIYQKN